MGELSGQFVTVFLGFFAIMNPFSNIAIFTSLVDDYEKAEQIRIARKALIIAFCVVVVFAVLGKAIFHLFGITLPALRIAGGILVFLIGYQMIQGHSSKMHGSGEEGDADIAVSPLAVPLLAGPGTIATAMNFSAAGGWASIFITIATFAVLCVLTFVLFVFGQRLVSLLGKSGLSIITRLMGLILAVIGVQMLIVGVMDVVNTPIQSI